MTPEIRVLDAASGGLTLPGGAIVGHAAVTHIGVLPSFTRQGAATALVDHQLRDFAAHGEAVATARASEATIVRYRPVDTASWFVSEQQILQSPGWRG
ncbi:putative acetyltransferase involved in intracellular survival [Mycobacterium basiliense]|uniref:Putative acetyltransferase involved in intracellular survival n=1 Tax=Mycobacterium basiliense TaxID=2094119 RepID=A0A3S4CS38_9MYCO|nr:putative acetyltransferase involved in intracellular survival [Mycobacterium basiliense]